MFFIIIMLFILQLGFLLHVKTAGPCQCKVFMSKDLPHPPLLP